MATKDPIVLDSTGKSIAEALNTFKSTVATSMAVDQNLSSASENPISNQVVTKALQGMILYASATLPAANWTISATNDYYIQTITVEGIDDSMRPILGLMTTDGPEDESVRSAYGTIYRVVSGMNEVKFYSNDAISLDIPVQIIFLKEVKA